MSTRPSNGVTRRSRLRAIATAGAVLALAVAGCGSTTIVKTTIVKTVVAPSTRTTATIPYLPGSRPVALGVARRVRLGSTVAQVEGKLGPPGGGGYLKHGVHCLFYNLLGYAPSQELIQFCFQTGKLITIASKVG